MLKYALKSLNETAKSHFDWVESCGWHNKTVLEALALIASEVGESFQELLSANTGEKFATELCDITLRIIDLCVLLAIDIDSVYKELQSSTSIKNWSERSNSDLLGLICVHLANSINIARKDSLNAEFATELVAIVALCKYVSVINNNDFELILAQKMELNRKNGTRGRKV